MRMQNFAIIPRVVVGRAELLVGFPMKARPLLLLLVLSGTAPTHSFGIPVPVTAGISAMAAMLTAMLRPRDAFRKAILWPSRQVCTAGAWACASAWRVAAAPWRHGIAEDPVPQPAQRRTRLTPSAPFSCRSGHCPAPVPAALAPRPYSGGSLLSLQYAASVADVTREVFGADSAFFAAFLRRKKCSAVDIGRWRCDGHACERVVAYSNPPSPLVQGHRAVERQRLTSPLEDGGLCVIDVSTETADAPFGETFFTKLRYVIRAVGAGDGGASGAPDSWPTTQLLVSWEMEWRSRRASSMVRSLVGAGAAKGLRSNFRDFRTTLDAHLSRR